MRVWQLAAIGFLGFLNRGTSSTMKTKMRAAGLVIVAIWTMACSGKVNGGNKCADQAACDPSSQAGSTSTAGNNGGGGRRPTISNGGSGDNDGIGGSGDNGGSGGSGNNFGNGGSGGPTTGHLVPNKLDLLLMIDNSPSMQEKQDLLKTALPLLLARLVRPICVDSDGKPTGAAATDGQCPSGKGAPELRPMNDIHIGIISSSLGSHGGTVCATTTSADDTLDDKGRLIPSMRTGVASWNNSGFLAWDATGKANAPPGESNPAALSMAFQNVLGAVGEHGCGYEASLESWYRFLIDPEPPADVVRSGSTTVRGSARTVNADGSFGQCVGCDDILLAQRKAFLRPDSAVAIVMLSDENDCSIRDDSVGWFVGSTSRMPLSTAVCATNPNDPCCRSCAQQENSPPSGCMALNADATCKNVPSGASYATWDALHDSLNLRCFAQHQRFGFDLLYDTSRYVDALKNKTIALQSTGKAVANPLYTPTDPSQPARDPSLVFLMGIVGVPWQDIADDASLSDTGLNYLNAKQLADKGRWPVLLGVPRPAGGAAPAPPTDPFMIETTAERSGTNPIVNVAISPASSMKPDANVINGHEQNIPNFDDLQYACIFPRQTPKDCQPNDPGCDCSPDKAGNSDAVLAANSPLCQGGTTINQQTYAKAYPGVRELQVLKDLGDNAIVASICLKQVKFVGFADNDPNFGYNPAVNALIKRIKDVF